MTKRKTHSPDFKAKVALEAIVKEMPMAELSKKYVAVAVILEPAARARDGSLSEYAILPTKR
jgi:hypothetical protein